MKEECWNTRSGAGYSVQMSSLGGVCFNAKRQLCDSFHEIHFHLR